MRAKSTSPCLTLNLFEDLLSQQSPFHPCSPCREDTDEQQNSPNLGVVRQGAEERGRRKAELLQEEAGYSSGTWAGVRTPFSCSIPDLGLVVSTHSGSDYVSSPADAHVGSLIS